MQQDRKEKKKNTDTVIITLFRAVFNACIALLFLRVAHGGKKLQAFTQQTLDL